MIVCAAAYDPAMDENTEFGCSCGVGDSCDIGRHIGHGVHVREVAKGSALIVGHFHDDGRVCQGTVLLDVPANDGFKDRPRWTVESREPLTVSPSVLNSACGLHGFIRVGRWVPA